MVFEDWGGGGRLVLFCLLPTTTHGRTVDGLEGPSAPVEGVKGDGGGVAQGGPRRQRVGCVGEWVGWMDGVDESVE